MRLSCLGSPLEHDPYGVHEGGRERRERPSEGWGKRDAQGKRHSDTLVTEEKERGREEKVM